MKKIFVDTFLIFQIILWSNLFGSNFLCQAEESQDIATNENVVNSELTSEAFIDTYYLHDFNNLKTRNRPCTTQGYYDDEPAINLGYVDAKLSTDKWHGRLALQGGSSVRANYASEPKEFWQYVQEAYVGYQVSEKLWIDSGVYFSHLGPESWISRDNWTYTRSLISEYSPYYQTGARATYQWSKDVTAQLHLINGWQNISDDRNPALGMQLSFQMSPTQTFTYNNFIGNEKGIRIFNDFIYKYEPTDRLGFIMAFDIGSQERDSGENTAWWYGFSLMSRYKITSTISLSGRVEQYRDPHQVILLSEAPDSFNAIGLSTGVDISLLKKLLWRTEYKALIDNDKVFPRGNNFSDSSSFIVTSLTYSYDLY